MDYLFDFKEKEKFRLQELEANVKDIYYKYDNKLKEGLAALNKKEQVPQKVND